MPNSINTKMFIFIVWISHLTKNIGFGGSTQHRSSEGNFLLGVNELGCPLILGAADQRYAGEDC